AGPSTVLVAPVAGGGGNRRGGVGRMAEIRPGPDIEARRMELRGIIHLASEVIGQYWPMRTFVHHNPLHSLEYLHFDEAVRRGRQFLGGAGYLPSAAYREYLGNGRIQLGHLQDALKPLAQDKYVTVGSIKVPHADVLLACLTRDLGRPAKEPLDALAEDRHQVALEHLAAHLVPAVKLPDLQERASEAVIADRKALGTQFT